MSLICTYIDSNIDYNESIGFLSVKITYCSLLYSQDTIRLFYMESKVPFVKSSSTKYIVIYLFDKSSIFVLRTYFISERSKMSLHSFFMCSYNKACNDCIQFNLIEFVFITYFSNSPLK